MPPLWTPAAKPLPYARGECTSSPQPRKGTRFRRDISSLGPGHTDRQAPTPCSMQMPHGVTPQQVHTSQGLHPRAKAPYWPPPRHSTTYRPTRQAEALELRCPGKVHGPPATTTTGVKTQPKARPKQSPRSPEPVLRLTGQPLRQLSIFSSNSGKFKLMPRPAGCSKSFYKFQG